MFKKFSSSIDQGTKGLTMCKKCFTFYYKNSWHFERPEYLNQDDEVKIPVHFKVCLACMEQEQALYETESNLSYMEQEQALYETESNLVLQ